MDPGEPIPTVRLASDGADPQSAFDRFRQFALEMYEVSCSREDREGFRFDINNHLVGGVVITSGQLCTAQFQRSAALSTQSVDMVAVNVLLSGGWEGNAGRSNVDASSGAIMAFDISRPLDLVASAQNTLVLGVPAALISGAGLSRDLFNGARLQGATGALLGHYLQALIRILPQTANREAEALQRSLLSLLSIAVSANAHDVGSRTVQSAVRLLATRYIRKTLAMPDLTPEQVAKAIGVSRSALYAAFTEEGGVRSYINAARLDAARQALLDDGGGHSIQAVAYRFGFASPEHFSRIFKQRFGLTPREVRWSVDRSF